MANADQEKSFPMAETIETCNATASTVIAMIESEDALGAIDEIAAVEGVEVLLIGSADLTIDMGIPGQFKSDQYRDAVQTVGNACKRHGRVLGVAGLYDDAEMHDWLLNKVGVRFMLLAQDSPSISSGASRAVKSLPGIVSQ